MDFEDENLDIMQNIESVIVMFYQQFPELTDYDVDKTYDALIKTYRSQSAAETPTKPRGDLAVLVYDLVADVIEWRLGRKNLQDESGKPVPHPEPVEPQVIVACLKRLRKSVETWTKQGGRQGYLFYISQFL